MMTPNQGFIAIKTSKIFLILSLAYRNQIYYLAAIFGSILHASYYVINKYYIDSVSSPLTFAFGSSFFGALISFFLVLCYGRSKQILTIEKKLWFWIIVYGLVTGVLARGFLFIGQSYATVTNTGFLIGGARPFSALLFGYLFMRETISIKQFFIVILVVIGVLILTSDNQIKLGLGDVIILLSGITLGAGHALSRRISTAGLHPMIVTFFETMIAALGLCVLVSITSEISFIGWQGWILSGAVIGIAVIFRNLALSGLKAPIVSSLVLISPVISTFLGIVLLHEKVTILQLLGGTIILLGGFALIMIGSRSN